MIAKALRYMRNLDEMLVCQYWLKLTQIPDYYIFMP